MILFLVTVLSVGIAVLLGRLILGGILRLTFQRARDFVKRAIERRRAERRDRPRAAAQRRDQVRRKQAPPERS